QKSFGFICIGISTGDVSGSWWLDCNWQLFSNYVFESHQEFLDGYPIPSSQVDHGVIDLIFRAFSNGFIEILDRLQVRKCQVPNVQVITDARTIAGRPVNASQVKDRFPPHRDFHKFSDQMTGV